MRRFLQFLRKTTRSQFAANVFQEFREEGQNVNRVLTQVLLELWNMLLSIFAYYILAFLVGVHEVQK